MSIHQRAREAAMWHHSWHYQKLEKAPTEWVVRQDMVPFNKYIMSELKKI